MNEPLISLMPYIMSLLLSALVGVYAYSRRRIAGARLFALIAAMQAVNTLGFILELMSDNLAGKIFWDDVQFIGPVLMPVAWLLFTRIYVGQPKALPNSIQMLLGMFILVSFGLIVTDTTHGLIRPDPRVIEGEPFSQLTYTYSPSTLLIFTFGYVVVSWSMVLLVRRLFRGPRLYRTQALIILGGLMLPVLGGLVSIADIELIGQRDLAPITFTLGNVLVAWGLFRFQLFDVVPLARDIVFDNISDMVFVIDQQDRVVDVNRAASALAELSDEDVIGKPVIDLFPGAEDMVRNALTTTMPVTEIEYVDDELGSVFFDVHLSTIVNRRNEQVGRVGVLRNITKRKEVEEALRQAQQEAEQARGVAEQADQIKTQFLASMSHELRTPLNGVLSLVEMVTVEMFGPLNESQRDYLQKAINSGEHLLALINDILDINKMQSGMLNLYYEDNVYIESSLEQLVDAAEALVADNPVTIIADIDPGLPTLRCDQRRIHQVLLNLLSNAAKFTDKGSITFSVKHFDDDELLFVVSDTGPGIKPEDHDAVFEPFVQTDTSKSHPGGTGLGMPITKHLVEAHGGRIWLDSEPGEGATFYVAIPIGHGSEKDSTSGKS